MILYSLFFFDKIIALRKKVVLEYIIAVYGYDFEFSFFASFKPPRSELLSILSGMLTDSLRKSWVSNQLGTEASFEFLP